jgi:hypothetical protein
VDSRDLRQRGWTSFQGMVQKYDLPLAGKTRRVLSSWQYTCSRHTPSFAKVLIAIFALCLHRSSSSLYQSLPVTRQERHSLKPTIRPLAQTSEPFCHCGSKYLVSWSLLGGDSRFSSFFLFLGWCAVIETTKSAAK